MLEPKPMKYISQAMQFNKMPEHQLLESAHDILTDNGISFLSRAIEYIHNERKEITELLKGNPELSIAKLSEEFEQQLAFDRRKQDVMQKARAELGTRRRGLDCETRRLWWSRDDVGQLDWEVTWAHTQ